MCFCAKIDPWKYLVWIFEELPRVKVKADTFSNYTPAAYAKSMRKERHKKRVVINVISDHLRHLRQKVHHKTLTYSGWSLFWRVRMNRNSCRSAYVADRNCKELRPASFRKPMDFVVAVGCVIFVIAEFCSFCEVNHPTYYSTP